MNDVELPNWKSGRLRILSSAPYVAETPDDAPDDDTTPIERFFLRDNGVPPPPAPEPQAWRLRVVGMVRRPLDLSLAELKRAFEIVTYRMTLECGGNGRAFLDPPARGNPWTQGGIGCAEWTGVRLRDVLRACRVDRAASHTAHFGADTALSGLGPAIARGMPLSKALEPHRLIVFGMNGEPPPHPHGGPLRLIVPGWAGSLS